MTREVDYGLRILRALHQEGQLSAASIAQKENMPKAITLKILKQLHAAGLTDSRRGSSGGYALQRPCETPFLLGPFPAPGGTPPVNRRPPGEQRRLPAARPL